MTIVAAVDRSGQDGPVIEEAAELAEAFGEPLHVIHVMSDADFVELQVDSSNKGGRPVEMERIRELAAEKAHEAAAGIDVDFEAIGRTGRVRREVLRYADEQDARYLVIGGTHRSPTGKALFGSHTQSILLNSDRTVVTVMRPE